MFGKEKTVLIMEPAYPAYVDANVIAGNTIIHIPAGEENGFVPVPDPDIAADVIYICSPNNPTGAVFDREALQAWVDYANKMNAIILFDAAYEAFIEEDDIPHSIFEIPEARTCAIEICSLSKTAGFTGTRCGYTVIPKELVSRRNESEPDVGKKPDDENKRCILSYPKKELRLYLRKKDSGRFGGDSNL